jgi:Flp pilus assembly protein TadG
MRRRLGKSGSSAVEFALVMTPFIALMFVVVEYGRAYYTRNALQQLAQATARCMAVLNASCQDGSGNYSASATGNYVQTGATARLIPVPTGQVVLNRSATCGGISGFSQVTLVSPFSTVVPTILTTLGASTNLQAVACYPNQ